MTEERTSFAQTRARLEEIVGQVRRKDVPLERCLDLLEEGERLANECTKLSDHTEWRSVIKEQEAAEAVEENDAPGEGAAATSSDAAVADEAAATGRTATVPEVDAAEQELDAGDESEPATFE